VFVIVSHLHKINTYKAITSNECKQPVYCTTHVTPNFVCTKIQLFKYLIYLLLCYFHTGKICWCLLIDACLICILPYTMCLNQYLVSYFLCEYKASQTKVLRNAQSSWIINMSQLNCIISYQALGFQQHKKRFVLLQVPFKVWSLKEHFCTALNTLWRKGSI